MLFDFDNYDIYSFEKIPGSDFNRKITTVTEGFLKGNMFNDEYIPYKNYKYKELKPNSDKEEKLYNIMALDFAINDLNLFLDLHPDDQENLKNYKSFVKQKEQLESEYAKEYEPLKLEQVEGKSFNWVSSFPWEKTGGSKYV